MGLYIVHSVLEDKASGMVPRAPRVLFADSSWK